jgi:saccharopine dehydrogenase (NADP+, L-glutamate forming)
MENVETMTHRSFLQSFLDSKSGLTCEQNIASAFGLSDTSDEIEKLRWSGLFSDERVGLDKGTPARILEHILNKKWKLNLNDKDQIVMWHRFVYRLNGGVKEIQSSLVATGTDSVYTAMAKTVGLPLAISAKLLLEKKISARGVVIPTKPEFYGPVLTELQTQGIVFHEM